MNRLIAGLRRSVTLAALLPLTAAAQDVLSPQREPPEFWTTRTDVSISIDGELNESVWQRALSITEFVQREPIEGAPTSYRTEVRVVFDDDALYMGVICHQPRDAVRARNLRRDFEFEENDVFGVAIDGFLDRRNAVAFQTTPYGSQSDLEVIDAAEGNLEWDARWHVRTKISDTYWTAEIAIPWRALRYPADTDRLGVVFARNIRSRNEHTSVPAVPRVLPTYRMSYEGELRGIAPPPASMNVQLNPYLLQRRLTDSRGSSESDEETGGELKWAITPSTVLDLTWNTDFAQADVDRRVTNLDRFSVFFPERRQFFLENANVFNASVTEWISPFFSRRIGLDEAGEPIPLDGGLRLTSRSAEQQIGVLALRQQKLNASPASNFAVARYSRNVLGQSRLGGMMTYRRDESLDFGERHRDGNDNFTYTLDGLWQPDESFGMQGMLSASTDDRTGDGLGGQLWAFFRNNRLNISVLEYYDRDYNPGIGLELLDTNYVMHSLQANYDYDFRSAKLPASIRSFSPGISAFVFDSSENGDLLFAYAPIRPFRLLFQNGALIDAYVEPNWQRLTEPFFPLGIEIAPGRYDYTRYRVSARTDQSATVAATASIETGDYFDGELTTYSLSARVVPWPYLELSADVEINEIRDLGVVARDTQDGLYGISARLALNPRLQLTGLYQWDDSTGRSTWNVRLSWEYQPLSYFYVVYNKSATDGSNAVERFEREQIIAKLTYLFDL